MLWPSMVQGHGAPAAAEALDEPRVGVHEMPHLVLDADATAWSGHVPLSSCTQFIHDKGDLTSH